MLDVKELHLIYNEFLNSKASNASSYNYSLVWEMSMLNEGGGSISSHLTNISFMKHVVLKVTLDISFGDDDPNYSYDKYYNYDEDVVSHKYARRGDIRITLESPQGTESELLPYRNHDLLNTKGYNNLEFLNVHFLEENPIGNWKLRISYKSTIGVVTVSNMSVTFFGTEAVPASVSSTRSHCSEECDYKCSYDSGLEICDICKSKRDSETLKCLTVCPKDYDEINNYCMKFNSTYFYNSSANVQIVDISPSMTDILQSTSRVYNDFSNQHQYLLLLAPCLEHLTAPVTNQLIFPAVINSTRITTKQVFQPPQPHNLFKNYLFLVV